ncbi:hypothetical protein GCM10027262_74800 [Nocardia tengchongensis]
MTHTLLEGIRISLASLPDSETWIPKLYSDMARRKPADYEKLLEQIARGAGTRTIFVAETEDHSIAGFIDCELRPDGAGQIYAWHLREEFHAKRTEYPDKNLATGLMDTAKAYLGEVDIFSNTTVETHALPAHLRQGFEIDESVAAEDPRLGTPSAWIEFGCPPTIELADGTVREVGKQVVLVRRKPGRAQAAALEIH